MPVKHRWGTVTMHLTLKQTRLWIR